MSSSAHLATSSHGAIAHNSRENFSHSVVFTDEKNECSHTAKEAFTIYRQELALRSKAYSDRTGQSLQKKTSTKLSCVINLEQHHTLSDVWPIGFWLEEKFDTRVNQIAIHRDEGKLVHKETKKELYSGKAFFKNPKDDKLYFDRKYTKLINLDEYDIKKNYHAHIEMLGIDSQGASIRAKMNKYALKELQDITAQSLGMERGKINSKNKRLDTHKYKEVGTAKQEAKEQQLATIKELKETIKELRAELKERGAVRADYAELEQKNKELTQQVKDKDLSIEKLNEVKKSYFSALKEISPKATNEREVVQHAQELTQKFESEMLTAAKMIVSIEAEKDKKIQELTQQVEDKDFTIEDLQKKANNIHKQGEAYYQKLVDIYNFLPLKSKAAVDKKDKPIEQASEVKNQTVNELQKNKTLSSTVAEQEQKIQKLEKKVATKETIIKINEQEQYQTALKSGFQPTKDNSWYAQIRDFIKDLKNRISTLMSENTKLRSENIALKTKISTLEARNSQKTSIDTPKQNLSVLETLKQKKAQIEKMSDAECYADHGKIKSQILEKIEKNIEIAEFAEKQKIEPKSPSLTAEDIQMIQKEYDKQNQKTQNRGLSL